MNWNWNKNSQTKHCKTNENGTISVCLHMRCNAFLELIFICLYFFLFHYLIKSTILIAFPFWEYDTLLFSRTALGIDINDRNVRIECLFSGHKNKYNTPFPYFTSLARYWTFIECMSLLCISTYFVLIGFGNII